MLVINADNGIDPAASQAFLLIVDMTNQGSRSPRRRGTSRSTPEPMRRSRRSPKWQPGPEPRRVGHQQRTEWHDVDAGVLSARPADRDDVSSTFDLGNSATPGEDGELVRVTFTNAVGNITSSPAKLTVDYAPGVSGQPTDATISAGGTAKFTSSATGEPRAKHAVAGLDGRRDQLDGRRRRNCRHADTAERPGVRRRTRISRRILELRRRDQERRSHAERADGTRDHGRAGGS